MQKVVRKALKLLKLIREDRYRAALRHGVAAAIEHEQILRALSREGMDWVVDVGANVGQFALAARHHCPDAQIISFEPLTAPARRFEQLFQGDDQVRLVRAAIGAERSEVEMHISKAIDSSSLLPIGRAQVDIFPGTEESHRERVQVAPLEEYLEPDALSGRALLKIDVQGYELPVLQGCEPLLTRFSAVYVESSFVELYEGQALAHDIIDWLHQHGFQLGRIGALTFDKEGLSVQGDFLFLRREP